MAWATAQVAVILSATSFLMCLVWLAAYRPIIFIGFFFILFTFGWRTVSMTYIDLAGPQLSTQTYQFVGPGWVTPVHIFSYFVTLAPFAILLRRAAVRSWLADIDERPAAAGVVTLSGLTLICSFAFVGQLFFDLVDRQTIPLFSRMERFVYTAQFAGAPIAG